MKKTIQINLAGFVFVIEQEAYEKLEIYLNAIEANFIDEAERTEIMRDIEARIVELFNDRKQGKDVIDASDVEYIIQVLGSPEDYISDEEPVKSEFSDDSKRLYKDEDNAKIGGVCAGLAAYFALDITIVRMLFILMVILGFSGVLVYLILLFVLPTARTPNEKLKMRGAPINVDSIKDEFRKGKYGEKVSDQASKFSRTVSRGVDKSIKASGGLVRAGVKIIGALMVIFSLFFGISFLSLIFSQSGFIPMWEEYNNLTLYSFFNVLYQGDFQGTMAYYALIMMVAIPIVVCFYFGLKILFNLKSRAKVVTIGMLSAWLIAIAVLTVTSISLGINFKDDAELTENINLDADTNVLYIDIADDEIFSNHIQRSDIYNDIEFIKLENNKIIYGYPELRIVENNQDSTFKLSIKKEARGYSQTDALNRLEKIEYNYTITGNKLQLDPYFSTLIEDKFRGQYVSIIVSVPANHKVVLGENIDRIILPIRTRNPEYTDYNSLANTSWTNENSSLNPTD